MMAGNHSRSGCERPVYFEESFQRRPIRNVRPFCGMESWRCALGCRVRILLVEQIADGADELEGPANRLDHRHGGKRCRWKACCRRASSGC